MQVRALIGAEADTEDAARRVAAGVHIDTGNAASAVAAMTIRAIGPATEGDAHWAASFDVEVPRPATIALRAYNGAIVIEDFRGAATFHTRNGRLTVRRSGGDLHGDTVNGGITVDLEGARWEAAGLDVETRNGSIEVAVPDDYSAILDVGSARGKVSTHFPMTVQGVVGRTLTTTLGAGGPRLHAITTNGRVEIRRKER